MEEGILKALLEEKEYNENFYDEEPEFYEKFDYTRNESVKSIKVDDGGDTVIRYSTSNVNGDNLKYEYKIINISGITLGKELYEPAIQKSYLGDNFLFYIQRLENTLYISRVELPKDGNVIDASKASKMILNNFGHSQVLEYFSHKGKSYFWIGCKGSDEDYNWSTQLARVEFVPGQIVNYKSCKRLSSISYANELGTSIGPIRRVEAALSTDKKHLLIWARTYQIDDEGNRGYYKTRFSIYDAKAVNDALDENLDNKYLPCTDERVKSACVSSFEYVPGDSSADDLRYGSNQGLEINNSKQILLVSESRSKGQSQGKYIYKINSSGTILSRTLLTGYMMGAGSVTEMEGLQIKRYKMYFALKDYSLDGNVHYIYRIE
ncbi:helveticin J family class III bacteriocin [Eubacterium uniforme]|uniref:helveticin J family class III bacteriocin n=1 Tax=Eubacterium uniforme TaxID=39495 RepID=UPI001179F5DC|nr:helveticin J family class III bacteriocin [Eubacterium uniforme]